MNSQVYLSSIDIAGAPIPNSANVHCSGHQWYSISHYIGTQYVGSWLYQFVCVVIWYFATRNICMRSEPRLNIKMVFPCMEIFIIKIKTVVVLVRRHLYIETAPLDDVGPADGPVTFRQRAVPRLYLYYQTDCTQWVFISWYDTNYTSKFTTKSFSALYHTYQPSFASKDIFDLSGTVCKAIEWRVDGFRHW